jgi:hypothetical protein
MLRTIGRIPAQAGWGVQRRAAGPIIGSEAGAVSCHNDADGGGTTSWIAA